MEIKSSEIQKKRLSNIKQLAYIECGNQEKFAVSIGMYPQNLSKIFTGKRKVSDKLCKKIQETYPKYNIRWIMGEDVPMLQDDFYKLQWDELLSDNKAFERVIQWALKEACNLEKRKYAPIEKESNEYCFILSQLRDYAIYLMRQYLNKDNSYISSYMDFMLLVATKENPLKEIMKNAIET